MKTIDFSYFIERYNAGEMNESEKQWFRKELEGNEKLRNEVDLRKHTDEALKNHEIISLRNKLSTIEKRRAADIPVAKSKKPAYLKYAAFVAGLVLISSIIVVRDKNLSSEEIMDRYYKSYEAPTTSRSGLYETNAEFTLALDYYKTRDYERAADLFNKIVANNPKDMQSTLLNGIANFEINNYPEAEQSFGNVIDNTNNLFVDQAEWYLALCYVQTDQREKAIQLLKLIKAEAGYYRKDAKKILRNLK